MHLLINLTVIQLSHAILESWHLEKKQNGVWRHMWRNADLRIIETD